MKKIAALVALISFATAGYASAAAYTADTETATGKSVYGGIDAGVAAGATAVLLGKLSNGVRGRINWSTTGFAVASKHDNGSVAFGTAHDSTAIYKTEVGTGSGKIPSLGTIGTASFATWTAM